MFGIHGPVANPWMTVPPLRLPGSLYMLKVLDVGLRVLGVSLGTCDPNRTVLGWRTFDLGLS